MKVKNKLTPYPILSPYGDDYSDSSFDVKVEVHSKFGEVIIEIDFGVDNDGIQALIEEKRAVYAVHIECPSTSFRKIFRTAEEHLSVTLYESDLNDKIEVCTFIAAGERIEKYTNIKFHPDYAGIEFELEKGNILAVGGGRIIEIAKNNDDLESLPSIIKIHKKKDCKNGAISVDTDDSRYILIGIYEEIIDSYYSLGKNKFKNTILSMVLLPALEIVLLRMRSADDDEREKKWFQVIEGKLEENGIHIEDLDISNKKTSVLAVAQKIFGDPIIRSFKELEDLSMEE